MNDSNCTGQHNLGKIVSILRSAFYKYYKNKVWSLCENSRVLYYTVKNDCVTNFAAAIAISVNELAYAVIFFSAQKVIVAQET